MATNQSEVVVDPKKVLGELKIVLRNFARRILLENDDSLAALEDFKEATMKEYFAIGESFRLTKRDLVLLLFKGILDKTLITDA